MQFILKHSKKILTTLLIIIIFSGFTLLKPFKEKSHTQTKFILSTMITIKAYGNNSKKAVSQAMDRIYEIENIMSVYTENSDIWNINEGAFMTPIKVKQETFDVIERALHFSNITKGNFDLTIKPLSDLWGIGTEHAKVPTAEEIQRAINVIDYKDIELDKENNTIKLNQGNSGIDLGGIAKGYAGDEVIRILKENRIERAYADLGGNIVVLGKKKNGFSEHIKSKIKRKEVDRQQDWKIGIQDPYSARGSYMAIIEVSDKAVVTSGTYERNFKEDGKIYHHIIDPFIGYPVENGLLSATIVSKSSTDADALSTGVFVMGQEEGLQLIESIPTVEAIIINNKKQVFVTSGLKDKIKITDNNYTISTY